MKFVITSKYGTNVPLQRASTVGILTTSLSKTPSEINHILDQAIISKKTIDLGNGIKVTAQKS